MGLWEDLWGKRHWLCHLTWEDSSLSLLSSIMCACVHSVGVVNAPACMCGSQGTIWGSQFSPSAFIRTPEIALTSPGLYGKHLNPWSLHYGLNHPWTGNPGLPKLGNGAERAFVTLCFKTAGRCDQLSEVPAAVTSVSWQGRACNCEPGKSPFSIKLLLSWHFIQRNRGKH